MTLVKLKQQPVFTDNFNNSLQNFFTPFSSLYRDEFRSEKSSLIPVNILETATGFKLEIVAPGFSKEDFSIKLDKALLTISAERKEEKKVEGKVIRNEYQFNSFNRSFSLEKSIDGEAISAEYVNGILVLNLPKKAEVKAPVKQITIN